MKLFYRGVNHNSELATATTEVTGNGKYRGSVFPVHAATKVNKANRKSQMTYRGVSY